MYRAAEWIREQYSFFTKCDAIKVAVAEVNFPAWSKTVDLIYPRALKMTLKPRRLMVGGYNTIFNEA